ncbi:P-loop containing nucleoside triphosphate hydrolase protein, partial [Schizopora paradoxa]
MSPPRRSRRLNAQKGSPKPAQPRSSNVRDTNDTPSSPRRRKPAGGTPPRLDGLRDTKLTVEDVKRTVRDRLGLDFEIADWQAHVIHRVLSGHDSVSVAGTSYGKSIIFEGLSAMDLKKTVIVVCPLKILEKDQVQNSKDPSVWRRVRNGEFSIVYVSPEMLLSERFRSLLLDASFRSKIQAICVDEMHLVKEWGSDFREKYKELHRLRIYTGMEIPFLGCTATATTDTFNTVWKDLNFGCRPFWGVDVGIERPNLQFVVRKLENADNPILDVLNILPQVIDDKTSPNEIRKALFFRKTRDECCQSVQTLRRCLPSELRDTVQGFYSSLSEKAKDIRWDSFRKGNSRVIVSTVAASVGCNDPN